MDDALLSRIEDASINASAPLQQRWLDGWLVRYSPGKARRSRCIHPLAPGRLPLQARLEAAADLYASAGLPMVFRITPYTCPSDQDAALAGLGFARMDETCVMARWLPTGYAATAPLPGGTHGTTLSMADVARVLADMRQSPPHQEAGHLQRLQTSPVPYRAWAIRRDGDAEVMACGQWAQEGPMAGLYDVHTREAHRDRGLAKALCDQMLAQAAAHGATLAYLQVEGSNHTARRVYESLGFVAAYTYHYRQKL